MRVATGTLQLFDSLQNYLHDRKLRAAFRVRPETSGRIAEFSEHEAD